MAQDVPPGAYDGLLAAASAWADPERAQARAGTDPATMYHDLQLQCPVLRTSDTTVTLLKMEDILFVNMHHDVEQGTKFVGTAGPAIPLAFDGPEHRRYRRLLDPVFTAKRVAHLAPALAALADEMIDGFIDDGRVDAYLDWCEPLPSTMFLQIMGLPLEDLDDFLRFKNLTLSGTADPDLSMEERNAQRRDAVAWMEQYFTEDLERRERSGDPGEGFIAGLLTTEAEGDRLTRQEILDLMGFLMIAGLDTVAASLSCFLSHLARHPERRQLLLDDPALWPSAVEELMRYESPVTDGARVATADLDLPSGEHVTAGTIMAICWPAANVDPDAFDHPLEIDFRRASNKHLEFASGWHRCLGSHLARMELVTAMEVWHRRIPHYRVPDGVELVYAGNPRAPHHLPLEWDR